jgi:Fic family protein
VSLDPKPTTLAEIAQADALYKGFPDFVAWEGLTPSDVDLWDRFAASLNERRQSATPEALRSAVDVAVRAAALDTGAIEGLYDVDRGFTMTVALQSLAWEQAIEERGAGVRELFEAQLEAYELVLDAVTKKLPITEAWIRALHEKLCAPQKTYRVLTDLGWQEQELPKGQYKIRPNHVRLTDGTLHAYTPVDRVPEEMHRFLEQIRTPEFEAAHPVLQASYCHYALVVIHPFADGNGRVARALASIFFYRAQSIPLVIFANQRLAYLESLRVADLGDSRPVISFFADRGIDTMQLVAESLMTVGLSSPEELLRGLLLSAAAPSSQSPEELDNIAHRVFDALAAKFKSTLRALKIPTDSYFDVSQIFDDQPPSEPYRHIAFVEPPALRISIVLRSLGVRSGITVRVLPRASPLSAFGILVEARGNADKLEIRLEDVHPELSESFRLRLENWVRRRLTEILQDLESKKPVQ